ncbi:MULTISPECIES: LptE family protein [unclassified Schlesneria]|uniref:LptE family protein n=1 Tax=Schlesneria TaxID=656899 RepID=UPI0035A0830D
MNNEPTIAPRSTWMTPHPAGMIVVREQASRSDAHHLDGERRCGIRVTSRNWNWLSVVLAMLVSGCGYTVGNDFRTDIKSVAVPIFENTTNRQGIEYQLTEAVQKEITKRSHYRLSKGRNADTRLTGKIVGFRKDVLGETAQDDPRELQITLMVQVRWEDLRTGELIAEQELPLTPELIPLTGQAEFSPELGQSLATAMEDNLNSMARKIVNLMEVPW